MKEETKQVLVIAIAVVLLTLIAFALPTWYYASTYNSAMLNGYSQQTLQGISGVYWVKDGKVLGEK